MSSLESTVQNLLATYPTLFGRTNRLRVLNHLFCTIGGGYEWRSGALVSRFNAPRESDESSAARLHQTVEEYRDMKERMTAENEEPATYCYDLASCSALCTVPDDVKPDWLAGAAETIEWILSLDPHDSADAYYWRKRDREFPGTAAKRASLEAIRKLAEAAGLDTSVLPHPIVLGCTTPNKTSQELARAVAARLAERFGVAFTT